MAFDAGALVLAERHLIQALSLAQTSGNRLLGAHIPAGMSDQASQLGFRRTVASSIRTSVASLRMRPSTVRAAYTVLAGQPATRATQARSGASVAVDRSGISRANAAATVSSTDSTTSTVIPDASTSAGSDQPECVSAGVGHGKILVGGQINPNGRPRAPAAARSGGKIFWRQGPFRPFGDAYTKGSWQAGGAPWSTSGRAIERWALSNRLFATQEF
jgi:hypothetical protein